MVKKRKLQNKRKPSVRRLVQVETKNALLELLKSDDEFEKIFVANNAYRDAKTKEIVRLAASKSIPVEKVSRKRIERISKSFQCESVIGLKKSRKEAKLSDLLDLKEKGENLFLLIFDYINYSQNVGALYRSAFASGVDGVVFPKRKSNFLTERVTRISMGTSERIPTVQMNLFDAIKQLKDSGVKIVGIHMDGTSYYKEDLKGDVALIVGNEAKGISKRMIERCDSLVSIPMERGIDSLNVSAAGAIVMFEKQRQNKTRKKKL